MTAGKREKSERKKVKDEESSNNMSMRKRVKAMGVMTQFECVKRGEPGGQGIGEGVIEVEVGRNREMEEDARGDRG